MSRQIDGDEGEGFKCACLSGNEPREEFVIVVVPFLP
jgi:hypothetical protein